MFVVDDALLVVSSDGGQGLGVLISEDEMRVWHGDGPRFLERDSNFAKQGVFHGLKIKVFLPANVQGEPANFYFRFTQASFVVIGFGTAGQEFDDDIPIFFLIVQFAGHLAKEITQGDVGLAGLLFVDHGIGVAMQGIVSQVIQLMVET